MKVTLRPSGTRIARRKLPKRSSRIGMFTFGVGMLFSAEELFADASEGCVGLYEQRRSPKTTRCPSIICNVISLVFMPGISKIAVRLDSSGSSIRSMLGK